MQSTSCNRYISPNIATLHHTDTQNSKQITKVIMLTNISLNIPAIFLMSLTLVEDLIFRFLNGERRPTSIVPRQLLEPQ